VEVGYHPIAFVRQPLRLQIKHIHKKDVSKALENACLLEQNTK
jgi:hypothetical protein